MPRTILPPEDYAALEEILPDLYKLRDLAELAPVILRITTQLIPNILCTYNEMNFRTGTVIAAYHPESMREPMEALMPELSASVAQHPIYQKAFKTGEGHPQFLSDYLTEKEAADHPFVRSAEKLNVRDHLLFSLQNSHQSWIFIAVSRPQRDFSERDREVAHLLRRHFSAARDNAVAFTEAKAKALIFDRMIDSSPHGIILLDDEGRVQHMNLPAFDLLERYFQSKLSWKATLPPQILEWLKGQKASPLAAAAPLILSAEGRSMVIRSSQADRDHRILLLRESITQNGPQLLRTLGLSNREAEVLYWTSEGKSNSEIGIILSISFRTVEKHLETTYRKLQVETRMGAILLANRVLSAN